MRKVLLLLILSMVFVQARIPYNETMAIHFYNYNSIAFCSNDIIRKWSCVTTCQNTPMMENLRIVESELLDIKGFVGYQPYTNSIVAAFRGSYSRINWRTDFLLIKHQHFCEKCQVHSGFLLAWKSIKHDLIDAIDDLKTMHPNASVFVTGHSLGGALATMAAIDIQLFGINVEALYTFGCPRVGNQAFTQFLTQTVQTSYRVVNRADEVPQVPPRLLGFHHFGQEVWYRNYTEEPLFCNDNEKEDPSCQYSLPLKALNRTDHDYYFDLPLDCNRTEIISLIKYQ